MIWGNVYLRAFLLATAAVLLVYLLNVTRLAWRSFLIAQGYNLSTETQSTKQLESSLAAGITHIRSHVDIEMLLDLATYGGAKVMKDGQYGLEVGKRADLVVLPGNTPAQAVIEQPPRTFVIKDGQLVAKGGKLT